MLQQVNDPEVIEEVRAAFLAYNAALDAGDPDVLNGFFWQSPSTVRFGQTESLYGYAAISGFRSGKWKGGGNSRTLESVAIAALGPDVATTNAVFRSASGNRSRQSQTWARLPDGWRIAGAHLSPSPPD